VNGDALGIGFPREREFEIEATPPTSPGSMSPNERTSLAGKTDHIFASVLEADDAKIDDIIDSDNINKNNCKCVNGKDVKRTLHANLYPNVVVNQSNDGSDIDSDEEDFHLRMHRRNDSGQGSSVETSSTVSTNQAELYQVELNELDNCIEHSESYHRPCSTVYEDISVNGNRKGSRGNVWGEHSQNVSSVNQSFDEQVEDALRDIEISNEENIGIIRTGNSTKSGSFESKQRISETTDQKKK
jgi:hypothetical protein